MRSVVGANARVVPLSTTNPIPIEPFHHLMDPRSLPGGLAQNDTWAKCDMLNTVSVDRLSRATREGNVSRSE